MTWIIIPERPVVSALLLAALLIAFLYFARNPMRASLYKASRLLISVLRLQSRALSRVIGSVRQRNRETLLELGQQQIERKLERDFHHVNEIVANDLSSYPALQQNISQLITGLEEDYHKSAETPPVSPDWIEAIDAIVNLKEAQKGNANIAKVLSELCTSLEAQQKKTLETYRSGVSTRHKLLHAMMPHWRKLNNTVERVGGLLKNLTIKANEIDQSMTRYREIQSGSEKAERMLQVSSFNGLIKSVVILACLAAGAFLNYHLISTPLSQLPSAGGTIGTYSAAQVYSVTIVLMELVAGLFLLEALHITHMFPAFGALEERKRQYLVRASFGFILLFAVAGGALAYLGTQENADSVALLFALTGTEPQSLSAGFAIRQAIPQAAQMVLAVFLPFVLMFAAIPFESLVDSSRVILGILVVQVLNILLLVLRLLAAVVRYGCDIILSLYDVIVSLPLWLESKLHSAEIKNKTESPVADNGHELGNIK
ncbi:hypothetical protein [Reinekea marinisedimentorum]|uniref:Uncharacterized protein n=1 Tax=Reinekea marinisedimentorum TaxID=230495 RepID=A0A4R3I6T0_9GAMM|nr:hypothetical protein [Reinekea marinisedimentorum]TCS40800.1 hypothetical protein BCF53_108167 [Reinekea marinisedimentorum]